MSAIVMQRAALVLSLLSLSLPGAAMAACRADRAEVLTEAGVQAFRVEIADDLAEQQQGLMYRESMALSQGMLFVYDSPRPLSFWMRNTLIPLDILFFDETGTLTTVQANARPLDETPLPGGVSQFVLEINGGLAARMGITEGSRLRHPAVDPSLAAAACE
ncbi:DUF192 domain-containing protein [Oceanicola sp. S124]|uniref:DUF192 domain-containing protein n=1 Tax=Oceanicola sp. S124 TaxID=1042378 RepID=UPI0002558CB1|nr:DUF192 domain-containing protein [Oceanicola sp. S124]